MSMNYKTIKLLEENILKYVHNLGIGKAFKNTQISVSTKKNIEK